MIQKLGEAALKAWKGLWNTFPILLAVFLLISLANALVPKEVYSSLFRGSPLLDLLIGSGLGSILAGNPVTSYIIGGELLAQGISLLAVTSFIVTWVTVGIVQLPAESMVFGRRFAITRNATALVFSVIVTIITVSVVSLL